MTDLSDAAARSPGGGYRGRIPTTAFAALNLVRRTGRRNGGPMLPSNWIIAIRSSQSGGGQVTVNCTGADTIDGDWHLTM